MCLHQQSCPCLEKQATQQTPQPSVSEILTPLDGVSPLHQDVLFYKVFLTVSGFQHITYWENQSVPAKAIDQSGFVITTL